VTDPIFRISVYDKNRQFMCQIGDPTSLEVTVRFNAVSTLTMTVPLGHKRVPELMTDGARLRVLYRGEHLISGPITADALESNGGKKDTYTITVEDDFRVLREILGWQAPANAISNQGTAEYRKIVGNAEAILKLAVTENGVTRLSVPGLTVAPSLNRGTTIPGGVAFRMHPLADLLFPAVENAGLGVTVKQDGISLVVDVYEPVLQDTKLSVKGRTLKQVGMTRTRPTASRAIIGGSGEGKARYFRSLTNTARETQYGMRAEVFVDDRQSGSDYTQLVADIAAAAADLKDANTEVKEADRALDAAKNDQSNADMAFDLAQISGNVSASSKAQTKLFAANDKVTARQADYNAAVAEKNAKQAAYDTLNGALTTTRTAYYAALDDSGTNALTENGPKNGVSITLAGSGIFKYGPGGFHVGDKVPIEVTPGLILTEVIRECTLTWVSPTHASVEPAVGEISNQPQKRVAQFLGALARRLRNQETR